MQLAKISVCICTRNRPDDLACALASVVAGSAQPHEVIVADDSTDDTTRQLIGASFPHIIFVEGPRRGLGANRNAALRSTTGTHVLFIDDDVVMGVDFLHGAQNELLTLPANTILCGIELNHGTPIHPHNVTFLGYQARDYRDGDMFETVVINATIFPKPLFARTLFDENLVYGCEEMDFSLRAVKTHGHHIAFRPNLINAHFPSPKNRDFYAPFVEASRIYVTFKRYFWVERQRIKAAAFLLLAYAHILAHDVRRHGLKGLPAFATTVTRSLSYIRRCARDPAVYL